MPFGSSSFVFSPLLNHSVGALLPDNGPKATKPLPTGQEKRLLAFQAAPTLPGLESSPYLLGFAPKIS